MSTRSQDRETPGSESTLPACEPSPALPVLSREAWELVEYRLWDKIRAKMWATLAAFLTLVAIAGYLGIPAYINQQVEAERLKFEELRTSLAAEGRSNNVRSTLTSHLSFLWARDIAYFQRLLEELEAAINRYSQRDETSRENAIDLGRIVFRLRSFYATPEELTSEVRALTALFDSKPPKGNRQYPTVPLTEGEWAEFERRCYSNDLTELADAIELYTHLLGLVSAVERGHQLMLDSTIREPLQRAELYQEYNISIYPEYRRVLGVTFKNHLPIGSLQKFSWKILPETAGFAFMEDEKRFQQTINPEGESK